MRISNMPIKHGAIIVVLLSLAGTIIFTAGCGGGGVSGVTGIDTNTDDGSGYTSNTFAYTGNYASGSNITYADSTGASRTIFAVPGQVQFMVTPGSNLTVVKALVAANHGTIEAQLPALGHYLVSVESGKESEFIANIGIALDVTYKAPHFLIDSSSDYVDLSALLGPNGELPTMPNISALVGDETYLYVLDNYIKFHGVPVDNVASNGISGTGQQINIFKDGNSKIMPFDIAAATDILYKNITFNSTGRAVINFSQQGAWGDAQERPFSEAQYRDNEEAFLEYKCALLESLRQTNSDVFERTAFVVSAGNGVGNSGTAGLDLSEKISELREKYSHLFSPDGPHIIIVGGEDANGNVDTGFNYSSTPGDMIYAPGRGVRVDASGTTLDGTSFAAPQLTNLLIRLLAANPDRTIGEITKALREAALENNDNIPSQEAVQSKISTASPAYTLVVTKTGTGKGTISSSPTGISSGSDVISARYSFAPGTVVTLTASAASGSAFKGWSGDGSGTASTVMVTMNGSRIVTATFEQPASALIAGSWSGTYTFTGHGDGGLTYNDAGNISMNVTANGETNYSGTAYGTGIELRVVETGAHYGYTSSSGSVSGTIQAPLSGECAVTGTFSFPIAETGGTLNLRFTGTLNSLGIKGVFPSSSGGNQGSFSMTKSAQ
jgi:hypothetical protein